MSESAFEKRVAQTARALREQTDEGGVQTAARIRVVAERLLMQDPESPVAAAMLEVAKRTPAEIARMFAADSRDRIDDFDNDVSDEPNLEMLPLVDDAGKPVTNDSGQILYVTQEVAIQNGATAVVDPKTKLRVGWTKSLTKLELDDAPGADLLAVYEADGKTRDGSLTLTEGLNKEYKPVVDRNNPNSIIALQKPPEPKRRGLWRR